ncbi:type VI-B CRISPR-associated RNA-guided ribonuclease Cas13b [Neptunitalea lumnitzerae]|uniref:Uncharacterized protein n=1 Tax=Neptunitalea lumnitzerae TaxID=2965509 RepID=A0ABQ5MH01_9FLAO|nr:type VI-B CRISPR-associated RNA-guided ribonuclease Cas13b [Neptunitalea sp. Y10]GLB48694.1 hypothetical protein Y10_10620 [Neptunitalea sp. Y10]
MEHTTQPIGKGIYYTHTSITDKHYFAGFLNLAQNNIDAVFTAFEERFNPKNKGDQKQKNYIRAFDLYFTEQKTITDYEIGVDFLKQHLPMVQYLYLPIDHEKFAKKGNRDQLRRAHFKNSMLTFLSTIESLRNFYTHHYHAPIHINPDVYDLLDELFLKTIADVKKYKVKSDGSRHLLKKELGKELETLETLKLATLKEQKAKGEKVNLEPLAIKNGVLNDAFWHLTYKDGVNANYQSAYNRDTPAENGIAISESGLLFLLGLFLTRKQGEDLRSNIRGFKGKVVKNEDKEIDRNNNSLKYMATHWVFRHLSFKGVKNRLTTGFSQETLLVQIIDELSKVPDALYQTFTQAQKDQFVEDINQYITEGKKIHNLEDATVIHPVIRKRYENKFAYFVLRYLDEFANFPTLKFQLHLGNYVHDARTKKIEGTKYSTERVIKEKIKVFGKLSEVTNLKTDYFLKDQAPADTGWELFPNPSYNFVADNIPVFIDLSKSDVSGAKELYINLSKARGLETKTYSKRKEDKPTKQQIAGFIDKDLKPKSYKSIAMGMPTAMLSLNELPALLYDLLVHKKTGEEIETILVKKLIERHETIRNYKTTDALSSSEITKNLRRAKAQETIDTNKLIAAIQTEIDVTQEKLTLIDNNTKAFKDYRNTRKVIFTNRELGQEATWLAEDLKRFMPPSGRSQWKGYHHSQLQELLAYYQQKPKEALHLLEQFWNFKQDQHTWSAGIYTAFEQRFFDTFYRAYLSNRQKTLNALLTQIQGFKNENKRLKQFVKQQHLWDIFYKRLYTIDSLENQKNKLLAKPLVFPRGIFDAKPTYIRGVHIADNPEQYADWYSHFYHHTNYQRFYSYPRDYQDVFLTQDDPNFKSFKQKQDLKIKKTQIQDVFLLLIANALCKESFGSAAHITLAQLYLTQEERLAEEKKAREQSQREVGDKSDNVIKSNFVWSMTVPYEHGQIKEPAVKIKELGKFKKYLQDEKVQTLLSYDTSKYYEKTALEEELEIKDYSYEVIRRNILFKEIQEFEQWILQKWGFNGTNHPTELEQDGNPNFKKYLSQGILKKYKLANEEEVTWLDNDEKHSFKKISISEVESKSTLVQKMFLIILIRNKFAHNQLPKKEFYHLIKAFVQESNLESYSAVILSFVQQSITELKETVNAQLVQSN